MKPNKWSCSVTAFAMAMHMPVQYLIDVVGHDGSDIIFPGQPEPMCRRGFHIQELVRAAFRLGHTVTPIELFPVIATPNPSSYPNQPVAFNPDNFWEFDLYLNTNQGVVTGRGARCSHAVAFGDGYIFDPDGGVYPYSRERCEERGFFTQCLWIVK